MLLWCLGGWVLWSDQQMRAGLVWPRWRERGHLSCAALAKLWNLVHSLPPFSTMLQLFTCFEEKNKREIFAETRRSCDDLAWDNRVYREKAEDGVVEDMKGSDERSRGGCKIRANKRWENESGKRSQLEADMTEVNWKLSPQEREGQSGNNVLSFFNHWQTKWNLGWLRSNEKSRTDQSWSVNRSTV